RALCPWDAGRAVRLSGLDLRGRTREHPPAEDPALHDPGEDDPAGRAGPPLYPPGEGPPDHGADGHRSRRMDCAYPTLALRAQAGERIEIEVRQFPCKPNR